MKNLLQELIEQFDIYGDEGNTDVDDASDLGLDSGYPSKEGGDDAALKTGKDDSTNMNDECHCQCNCPCCQKARGEEVDDQDDFSGQDSNFKNAGEMGNDGSNPNLFSKGGRNDDEFDFNL